MSLIPSKSANYIVMTWTYPTEVFNHMTVHQVFEFKEQERGYVKTRIIYSSGKIKKSKGRKGYSLESFVKTGKVQRRKGKLTINYYETKEEMEVNIFFDVI